MTQNSRGVISQTWLYEWYFGQYQSSNIKDNIRGMISQTISQDDFTDNIKGVISQTIWKKWYHRQY